MQPLSLLFALSLGSSNTVLCGKVSCARTKNGIVDCDVILRSNHGDSEILVVTDSSGSFRIAGFDPGSFVVVFRHEHYESFQRELLIRLGTIRVNTELLPKQPKKNTSY